MTFSSSSWIDEFPTRIAALDQAHLRRRRRAVVPEGGAHLQVDGRKRSIDYASCSDAENLIGMSAVY